ncbi:pentapeptide repeat-containing protein [Nonomuraea basaltis]
MLIGCDLNDAAFTSASLKNADLTRSKRSGAEVTPGVGG